MLKSDTCAHLNLIKHCCFLAGIAFHCDYLTEICKQFPNTCGSLDCCMCLYVITVCLRLIDTITFSAPDINSNIRQPDSSAFCVECAEFGLVVSQYQYGLWSAKHFYTADVKHAFKSIVGHYSIRPGGVIEGEYFSAYDE